MRMGIKTVKTRTGNAMKKAGVCNKIWLFLLEKIFKLNFLLSKGTNHKKNFIRQHNVLLLFCERYRLSTLQMKSKKLNYKTAFQEKKE